MRQPKKPFTVEVRSSRMKARRKESASIWANVDISKALRDTEAQLPAEQAVVFSDLAQGTQKAVSEADH